MSRTIPLGRVHTVPIRVGTSWLVVAPVVGIALFAGIDPDLGGRGARVLVAVAGAIALFGSILLHELAHALVARRVGVEVRRVVLFLFGGYTEMEVDESRPGDEAAVSLAGPMVSGGVALAFWGLAAVVPETAGAAQVGGLVAVVNGAVAMFNLLPGFPLDGGRITRSLLVISGMKPRSADSMTAWLGIIIGSLLVTAGAAGHVAGRPTSLVAIPVGVMVIVLAWAARPVDRRTAADLMRPAPEPVGESATVASLRDRSGPVPVVSSGKVVGLITGRSISGLVAEVMDPVLPGDVVSTTTPVAEVVDRIRRHRRTMIVTGEEGIIVGMIGIGDLPSDLLSTGGENLME